MAQVPHWKSRRIASRVLEVFLRNKDGSPALAAYETSLTESATAVIQQYDDLLAIAQERRRTRMLRIEQGTKLLKSVRGWFGLVRIHVPSFRRADFTVRTDVMDDIISHVSAFIGVVDEHEEKTGVVLPFSEALRAELIGGLNEAKATSAKSGEQEVAFNRARRELKIACERFNEELVSFRSTLATVVGTSDPDYKRLRTSQFRSPDDEELEVEDPEPVGDEPASESASNMTGA